ncbi:uncharacterized protein LOC136074123 [Hydra vulgaris]|uniref:Uncharacterized protein LOC136074123 n=1 Tax=Hydra vulgaris TaxID=6087 RepID=A0ABM4B137_HYDVU
MDAIKIQQYVKELNEVFKKLPTICKKDKDKELKWTDKLASKLHRPCVKHFRKSKVILNGIDEIWAVDLVVMQYFPKLMTYGGIVPLKSKTAVDVADAFKKTFIDRKCQIIWVEKGLKFYNKHVKAFGVQLYSIENGEKSCEVERWNKTMKEKMFKYFSANSSTKYINVLDDMTKIQVEG